MNDINYKITADLCKELESSISNATSIYILTDSNTAKICLPALQGLPKLKEAKQLCIPAGEEHKTLEYLSHIWQTLSDEGATRQSLLINLGGGLITDMGGFAAATFKRGMPFINIPTTLLAAVDAATGGKNGIDFNGFKNEIGVFKLPEKVLINIDFFRTLSTEQFMAGFAEMVKHALITDTILYEQTMDFDLDTINYTRLSFLIESNLNIKRQMVQDDPFDSGKRRSLNFGHTIGHALEIFSIQQGEGVSHGLAVMWGMVGELFLSHKKYHFPLELLKEIVHFAHHYYAHINFSCDDYDNLILLMKHDKKNNGTEINFTFLTSIGDVRLNQTATNEEIKEALDFISDGI